MLYPFFRSLGSRVAFMAIQLVWLGGAGGWEIVLAKNLVEKVGKELERELSSQERQEPSFCRKEALCGKVVLARFYGRRGFRPAWMDPEGRFPQAIALTGSIRESSLEGLQSDAYHLAVAEALLGEVDRAAATGRPADTRVLSDLDLVLSDAFLLYGSHLLSGRVDPETIHSKWVAESREADMADLLETALDRRQVYEVLKGLLPKHPGYVRLRQALREYRGIIERGGWTSIQPGPTLHEDERSERVALLRARLVASGDLDANSGNDSDAELFDDKVERAVRRFQGRHGLVADGVVGPATLAELNVSPEERVRQIELNLERWRWLPDELGSRHILVNVPGFELEAVEKGDRVLAMRVVAGRKARRTPVFSGRMTYLVLNPYWHIPHTLAVRDVLPKVKTDPGYLGREKIRVFQNWDDMAPEIQPEAIDWSKVTKESFGFRLRQDPGPSNALGRMKLMFPNKFAVYLHDTPTRHMFDRNQRDFSSGCIRIEKPVDLAAYVMQGDPRWTRQDILSAIDSGQTRIVWLPEPIPVHLLYWTAWVDSEGTLHFRQDVYGRDGPLDRALREGPGHVSESVE